MLSLTDEQYRVRPGGETAPPADDWRRELQRAVRDPHELCELLGLPRELADDAPTGRFPLLVPRPFVARMRPGNPSDPLLLQVLPRPEERVAGGLPSDGVGDLAAVQTEGLLQKYAGRALLVLAPSCAVNCRYCFRRHFPYDTVPAGDEAWAPALQQIRDDPNLTEILLSGGDPLVWGDRRLARLVDTLGAIPHLRRLRIHTRLPIVIPQRVTDQLCRTLARTRLRVVVVLHVNHANEIDADVAASVERLRRSGAMLFNQSVLLRGVNDSADAQAALCERLVETGVTPYYLHQLDMVAEVGHFEAPVALGQAIVDELRNRLPGYAVPRYVREIPGEPCKTPLA